MSIHNADIAAIFDEIADLLEIQGENPFRIRAYRNAARQLESMGVPAAGMIANGEDLTELPGIGKDLAAKITEIVSTGRCQALEKLHRKLPPAITELLKIPGLGPKRVRVLHRELDVNTLAQLLRAARDGRVRAVPGFGEKTEAAILKDLEHRPAEGGRMKLAIAAQYAEPLAEWLRGTPGAGEVAVAGSYRRMRETVGDLDIVAGSRNPATLMARFTSYEEVTEVRAQGPTRATVVLKCGLQVDLRAVEPAAYGAALLYFTGSKAHNIALRKLAQQRGLKVNEYGAFRGRRRVAGASEAEMYSSLDLPFIPPELREDHGEIEAAQHRHLPVLIAYDALQGDLHCHTRATDGHHTLGEMAQAAAERGLRYLAITEHSQRLTMAHGLTPERLRKQCAAIDRYNRENGGITLLKGIEVDILEDGALDLPDDVLAELDLVIGAVHSKFDLSRARQTERILRAMEHPSFTLLAHPSGRMIDRREPYDVDWLRILRQAKAQGCFLELNAHPERLDLIDVYCRMARDEGVRVAVNSDAHRIQDFDNLRWGLGQARRGWLSADDVLNTRPLGELRRLLRRRGHAS